MSRAHGYGPSELRTDLGENNQNLDALAEEVAIQRGRCVAEVLFHIAAIRSVQGDAPTGKRALVRCSRALVQLSGARHGQQAAHLLPGQITVENEPVWELARSTERSATSAELFRVKQQTQLCFAATNVLPAMFNKADTEAEGSGSSSAAQTLKPLFGSVAQQLWRDARVDASRPLAIDRDATFAALGAWFRNITAVYSDASKRKAGRARTDEARVLERYAESFRVANPSRFVLAELPAIYQRYHFV